ncbi:hypothetical protein [Actinomadura rugatobispora]|uniref:LPXTG cell wall anchor domain-containing protein n=1 Tax=Actinomadura rugatobispora TaxID=1994 RepID=A0ABW1A217_9ACTN|nr:hypothetical protein GCM10010200_011370 [Actinomadura rugatobispora]
MAAVFQRCLLVLALTVGAAAGVATVTTTAGLGGLGVSAVAQADDDPDDDDDDDDGGGAPPARGGDDKQPRGGVDTGHGGTADDSTAWAIGALLGAAALTGGGLLWTRRRGTAG